MSFLSNIPKAIFDRLIPRYRDGISSSNLRNQFLALAEGDILPLRPTTEITVESMDYGKDTGAQAEWSGTGVTVEIDKVNQNDGIACLKLMIDVTGNRECKRAVLSPAVDLSNFAKLGVWNRCDKASSAIQFLIRDSSGNESYWDITTNATPDTFEQASLDLSSPDSNNGTNADLSDVTQYGYKGLDASSVYLFDSIFAYVWAMKIYITQSVQGSYFLQVYAGIDRVSFSGGFSPNMNAPAVDPRIDLVSITKSGTVEVATGTEEVSPDDSDIPACPFGNIPICAIYQKPSATKIVDYHQKDIYTSDSYIYKDLRPFMGMTGSGLIYKGEDAPPSTSAGMLWVYTPAAGNYILRIRDKDNNSWINIMEFDDSGLVKLVSAGIMSKIADFPAYVVGKFLKCTGASAISWEDITVPSTSVGQGELKTTTSEHSVANLTRDTTIDGLLVIGSGEYTFWWYSKDTYAGTMGNSEYTFCNGSWGRIQTTQSTYLSKRVNIQIICEDYAGTQRTVYARARYITASSKTHFVYFMVDKITKILIAGSSCPDHPNNGRKRLTDEEHPFREDFDPAKHEIVLIDNDVIKKAENLVTSDNSLLQVLQDNFEIDWESSPVYKNRETVEIDACGDKEGKLIRTVKVPESFKMLIDKETIQFKKRVYGKPDYIQYKKMKKK